VAAARTSLGEDIFVAAWQEGRAMPLEQAITYALAEPEPTPASTGPRAAPAADPWAPLTAREREVASLLAQGWSDRAIAERLVVTEGTVGQHAARIFSKLGLRSRAQLAAWAAELGLLPTHPGERGVRAPAPPQPADGARYT
jgi:DNA-binding NarL/FixJ family response regulator